MDDAVRVFRVLASAHRALHKPGQRPLSFASGREGPEAASREGKGTSSTEPFLHWSSMSLKKSSLLRTGSEPELVRAEARRPFSGLCS